VAEQLADDLFDAPLDIGHGARQEGTLQGPAQPPMLRRVGHEHRGGVVGAAISRSIPLDEKYRVLMMPGTRRSADHPYPEKGVAHDRAEVIDAAVMGNGSAMTSNQRC